MPDINPIDNGQTPIEGSISFPSSPLFTSNNSSASLDSISLSSVQNLEFTETTIPSLPSPGIVNVFDAISSATQDFKHQLSASEFIDQTTRRKQNTASAIQAAALAELLQKVDQALGDITGTANTEIINLQQRLSLIDSQTHTQQGRIESINEGNNEEKIKTNQQIQAYNQFIQVIMSLGGIDNGDGTYTIPPGANEAETQQKMAMYNAAANNYAIVTGNFNNYTDDRRSAIASYNSATNSYNSNVNQNNQYISNLINTYNLSNFLQSNHIPSMNQPNAGTRNIASIVYNDYPTQNISGFPTQVQVAKPPDWVYSSSSQVPSLGSISYTQLNTQQLNKIKEGILTYLREAVVAPLETQVNEAAAYYAYLRMLTIFYVSLQDTVPDPLLNYKTITKRILPDTILQQNQPMQTKLNAGAGGLSILSLGLGSIHLQGLLAKSLLAQTINNVNLNIGEQQRKDLADQLLVLSTNLLATNSLESLLPGLGSLNKYLSSLPSNSPAYGLLFSISFANRLQESLQQGILSSALQAFIDQSPLLTNLNASDRANLTNQLSPAFNLGLLLVATKLLAANLGLPGLPAQLLPSFLSSNLDSSQTNELLNSIQTKAFTEEQQAQIELSTQLQNNFIAKGFGTEEAQFLAQVGIELINQGLESPSATFISAETVQVPLLINSVKANLILSGFNKDLANQIAERSVNQTLLEGPFNLPNQFTSSLENNLRSFVAGKNANEVATNALMLPIEQPFFPSLVRLTPVLTQQEVIESLTLEQILQSLTQQEIIQFLSQAQLNAFLGQRVSELLTPQLGSDLSKFVSLEIAKTLFGTPNPDSTDQADAKSPYSLINVINNQLYQLNIRENNHYAEALRDSFKELIKESVQVYEFLDNLTNPAKELIYTGIMYSGITHSNSDTNWKRSIDILI